MWSNRLDLLWLTTMALALAVGCSDDDQQPRQDAAPLDALPGDGGGADTRSDAGVPGITTQKFGKLEKWATPIEDYIKAGRARYTSFLRQIHDLTVYQDRLYLGYGDANVNMGRVVPISFRYFSSPDSTTVVKEFNSDDEHLERYRHINGELFLAGVDSTEDAWLGNVYYKRKTDKWVKSRTLSGGVHVHDVIGFGGAIYSVGSGATKDEWTAGKIFGHLWKSTDKGKTFKIADKRPNAAGGDCRFVRLLPTAKMLYLFGYRSNPQGQAVDVINSSYDGTKRTDLPDNHPMRYIWASETYPLGAKLHVIRGYKIKVVSKLLFQTWRWTDDGKLEEVKPLAGQTVIDVFQDQTSKQILVLSHDENDYAKIPTLKQWKLHIYLTSDFKSFKELHSYSTITRPKSIAYWNKVIYVGDDAGVVWRSEGN